MTEQEKVPPAYGEGQEGQGGTSAPPPYATLPPQPAGYPPQPQPGNPSQPGYPTQPAPSGYPVQPAAQPNPGYPVQPPGVANPNNVVIVNQPGVVVQHTIGFRDTPVACQCPNCHNQVTSIVDREIGSLTLLIMGALCIFGLWLFCCLIPLCVNSCKDAVHTCPVCKYKLGRHTQL